MRDPHDPDPGPRPTWAVLSERLRQRKLVQWTLAYAAGGFALLQFLDIIGNRFGWPDTVLRVSIVLLGAGLLLTVVLAWYHGERGHQRVGGGEVLWVGAVCLATAIGVWAQLGRHQSAPPPGSLARTPAWGMTLPVER